MRERAAPPLAPMPPSVARQVRRAKVLAPPLATHLDAYCPAVPLQGAPQLSGSGKLPNVGACLLQAAGAVARDGPVAVNDRTHFSPSTANIAPTFMLGSPVNIVSCWKQRCPPMFPHVNSRIRQCALGRVGRREGPFRVGAFAQVNPYAATGLPGLLWQGSHAMTERPRRVYQGQRLFSNHKRDTAYRN